jgi:hypothetical protein
VQGHLRRSTIAVPALWRKPMRIARIFMSTLALTALTVIATPAGDEGAWFDEHKCGLCKKLSAERGLKENLRWENHLISSGMLSLAILPPEYHEALERAEESMKLLVKRMENGEPMELCGFCTSYGRLAMAGARSESVHSEAGHITLITSDDPSVVKMIHEHGQRTIDEYRRMLAARHDED